MTDFRRLIALVEAASTKVLIEAFWGMAAVENYDLDNTVTDDGVEIFVNPSQRELLSLGPPLRGFMGSSGDETLGNLFCWTSDILHGQIYGSRQGAIGGYKCMLRKDYISFQQDDANDLIYYAHLKGVPVCDICLKYQFKWVSDLPQRIERDPALKHELDTQLSLLRRAYGSRLRIESEAT